MLECSNLSIDESAFYMDTIQKARVLIKHAQAVLRRNYDYGESPFAHMSEYKSIGDYIKKKRKKQPKKKSKT